MELFSLKYQDGNQLFINLFSKLLTATYFLLSNFSMILFHFLLRKILLLLRINDLMIATLAIKNIIIPQMNPLVWLFNLCRFLLLLLSLLSPSLGFFKSDCDYLILYLLSPLLFNLYFLTSISLLIVLGAPGFPSLLSTGSIKQLTLTVPGSRKAA